MITATASTGGQLNEATDMATKAFLSQTKIDQMLDRYQQRLLTEQQRKHIGHAALAARIAIEKKVLFSWSY